jgi:hypothetical protein
MSGLAGNQAPGRSGVVGGGTVKLAATAMVSGNGMTPGEVAGIAAAEGNVGAYLQVLLALFINL